MENKTFLVENNLSKNYMSILRDVHTGMSDFRHAAHVISQFVLGYAASNVPLTKVAILTPLMKTIEDQIKETPYLVPILRAGLAMLPAALELFPNTEVGTIDLERIEKDEKISLNLFGDKIKKDLSTKTVWVLDPMLATGTTVSEVVSICKKRGAQNISILSVISCPEGINKVNTQHSDVSIYTAAIDTGLSKDKFIFPGLGDFGDRYFGSYK